MNSTFLFPLRCVHFFNAVYIQYSALDLVSLFWFSPFNTRKHETCCNNGFMKKLNEAERWNGLHIVRKDPNFDVTCYYSDVSIESSHRLTWLTLCAAAAAVCYFCNWRFHSINETSSEWNSPKMVNPWTSKTLRMRMLFSSDWTYENKCT